MLNIVELEKRWFTYKAKSFIPIAVIVLSIVTILFTSIYFFSHSNAQSTKKALEQISKDSKEEKNSKIIKEQITPPTKTIKKVKVVEKKTEYITPITTTKPKVQSVKLSPSLDFMKKMQNSVQPYYRTETSANIKETQQAKEIIREKEQLVQNGVKKESKKISIKREDTQNDILEIIKRFKKNNNPALSLFLAKKYYELANYNQAYNYALITNNINQNIEASWIVFSKSLVKLGKKNKAISILKKYIKQSHSSSAKILLDEIRAGKFK